MEPLQSHSDNTLSNIPEKHEVKEIQKKKTAVLGTAHIPRKVLM